MNELITGFVLYLSIAVSVAKLFNYLEKRKLKITYRNEKLELEDINIYLNILLGLLWPISLTTVIFSWICYYCFLKPIKFLFFRN